MAVDESKNTQILDSFPNEMVDKIKKYWHDNQIENRNEAIRKLVALGLKMSSRNDSMALFLCELPIYIYTHSCTVVSNKITL